MPEPLPDDPIAAIEALLREFTGGEPKKPRELLYCFQHVTLREAAFENHPELIRELESPSRAAPLVYFQVRARMLCEEPGLPGAEQSDDDSAIGAMIRLFEPVRILPYKRGGFTAHVVTMPKPEGDSECHFVAIVHRDGESREHMEESPSTRYMTLEMSHVSERPFLCEWTREGQHLNCGEGPEPDATLFADAVFNRIVR